MNFSKSSQKLCSKPPWAFCNCKNVNNPFAYLCELILMGVFFPALFIYSVNVMTLKCVNAWKQCYSKPLEGLVLNLMSGYQNPF
ncbi:hypothetical protein THIOM_004081 [Candidatus Thiomargarita nelsonii]|uniref:Uncharacterized protein n=1 Tax=Candidatus Thiomargarita nelsonii TaxID=1003181 RepID=A0A176RWS2_9GAMM|nr:hypothetical protein THIOM_004081 [Candidatus Thiomargarita nelsonii]